MGRGVAICWLLGGQAEEGGEQGRVGLPDQRPDELGGQRMTRPQRRPASLRAFPEPGLVMRWPGVGAPPVLCLSRRFCGVEGVRNRAGEQT